MLGQEIFVECGTKIGIKFGLEKWYKARKARYNVSSVSPGRKSRRLRERDALRSEGRTKNLIRGAKYPRLLD